jgi:hypothetical protein
MTAQSVTAVLCTEAEWGLLRYSDHYAEQLLRRPTPTRDEIRYILCEDDPQVIETDPANPPWSRTYLIWGVIYDGRAGHLLCTAPPNPKVVTAYWPAETEPDNWEDNYRRRARPSLGER